MNKKIWSIVGIVLVIFLVIGLTNNRPETATIKIGVAVPLTGNNAFAGEGIRNAINLAKDKLGKTKYKYEVIFEDTNTDPKSAATSAHKLIDIDKVDAIIDAYAPIGVTIAPLAERAKVVHIGIAFDPRVAEGKYNFINFITPDTAVRVFLSEMQKKGLSTLGILHINNPGILAVDKSLHKLSPEYGIRIVTDQEFQSGDRDFRSIITKAETSKPQIYALLSIAPELDILAKQMQELNLKNLTTVIYFETTPNKSLYEGLWSVGFGKSSADFEQEYKKVYGKDFSWAVPNSYDAFNLIISATESYTGENKPSSDYIANYLQNVKNYNGVLGKLNVDEAGIIDSPALVKIVRDGVLVPVE